MKSRHIFYIFVLFQNAWCIQCFEPITIGSLITWTAGVATVGYIGSLLSSNKEVKKVLKKGCSYVGYCEGCEDYWITDNLERLEVDLKINVFGQPIAVETVITSLKYHLNDKGRPTKALAMSFHGPPGVGKNLISQLILKNLFKKGAKTDYVHFFRGSIDFPGKRNVLEYQNIIKRIVEGKVEECNRSIFVFDEVDKMTPGILNVLQPYLDFNAVINGVDYRNTIFIFLSNLGKSAIIKRSLELWQYGKEREEFRMEDFLTTLTETVYNEKGGFYGSHLIRNFVIVDFIPFLPMEKQHVHQCLEREVAKMGQIMSDELYEQVLELLTFGPDPYELYAVNGCKQISEKAGTLIERELYKKRKNKLGYKSYY